MRNKLMMRLMQATGIAMILFTVIMGWVFIVIGEPMHPIIFGLGIAGGVFVLLFSPLLHDTQSVTQQQSREGVKT